MSASSGGRSGHWAQEQPWLGGGRGPWLRSRGRGGFTDRRLADKNTLSASVFVSVEDWANGPRTLVSSKTGFPVVSCPPDICYRCGESGHLAKDCDSSGGW